MNLDKDAPRVDIDLFLKKTKGNVEKYSQFVKHAPKLLRQSMMLAYQTAIDEMLMALDASRVDKPVFHVEQNDKKAIILDENGHLA